MNYSKVVRLVDTATGEETEIELQRIDTDSDFVTYCFKLQKDSENVPLAVHVGTPSGTSEPAKKRPSNNQKRITWMKLFMDAEYEKIGAANLTSRAQKINYALKTFAAWRGFVKCTHQQLADKTGIARPHVTTAIKELIEADVIIKIEPSRYRLNPSIYWIGPDEEHKPAVDQYYRQKRRVANKETNADKRKAAEVAKRRKQIKLVTTAPPA